MVKVDVTCQNSIDQQHLVKIRKVSHSSDILTDLITARTFPCYALILKNHCLSRYMSGGFSALWLWAAVGLFCLQVNYLVEIASVIGSQFVNVILLYTAVLYIRRERCVFTRPIYHHSQKSVVISWNVFG